MMQKIILTHIQNNTGPKLNLQLIINEEYYLEPVLAFKKHKTKIPELNKN